jgi:hypothetical protein
MKASSGVLTFGGVGDRATHAASCECHDNRVVGGDIEEQKKLEEFEGFRTNGSENI